MSDRDLQPLLHDLVTAVAAPTVVLSEASGQIRASGAQGAFSADVRVLSEAVVTVDGVEPEAASYSTHGAGEVEFVGMLRQLGDRLPDPTVWLRRRRTARPDGCAERLTLDNVTLEPITVTVRLRIAADLMGIEAVKSARTGAPAALAEHDGRFQAAGEQVTVSIEAPGAELGSTAESAEIVWKATIPARGEIDLHWSVAVQDSGGVVTAAGGPGSFAVPRIVADDRRLQPFVERSVADLQSLRMATVSDPEYPFLAAGSPWYLTLFGRDSIWAARMLLPLGTDLAGGTLRTLAARQGIKVDAQTAEQPGKILHEIRRGTQSFGVTTLPPVYYGSVDSTPLWVCLLGNAWRWGLPEREVAALLPAAEAALGWMADYGDSDGDGFLEYVDSSGTGLTNQGWKDSGDSIRFADGQIADGPVALAEVQGYAYEAALAGAALLEAFDRPGAARWHDYAEALAARFREKFWIADDLGSFPALALDGTKAAVDAPASNMGHLLGTGLLNKEESALVADRLLDPSMASGFGLRTMASTTGGYSPLSYHCGSIWPHDTAIAIHGLLRAGFAGHAARLAEGLLSASTAFDGRLPELYGGFDSAALPTPVPYGASCRPQAWSAASAVVMLQAFLGLEADVPNGTIQLTPSAELGSLQVTGLKVAGSPLGLTISADGTVTSMTKPDGLQVIR